MASIPPIAYLALSETFQGKDAGYTHTINITQALAHAKTPIELFLNGSHITTRRDGNLPITTLNFPRRHKPLSPIETLQSYILLKQKLRTTPIIHERFHINPIDLLFVHCKTYLLEINDPAPILYHGLSGTLYRILIQKKLNRCDAIITQTATLKKILQQFTEKPIHIIPNGVDIRLFKPTTAGKTVRKQYNIPNTTIVIGFLGSFNPWHGVQDIPAFARQLPNATFLLIGSGPFYNATKKTTTPLPNTILTGAQPYERIPAYLAACDILIAPFNPEHFPALQRYGFWWCPIKLYEYLAMGKPIVSYNYPEVRTIVGNAGILVPPGDKNAFITAVATLARNTSLRQRLGNNGITRARKNTWTHRAHALQEIYRKL